jgi:Histidine kinase-, DNA gyrase B-, and HSP90-like ATPase
LTEDLKGEEKALLGFVKKFADSGTMSIEEELGHGYVRLRVTEAERRQALQDIRCVEDVVKELVRNARDAEANIIYITFQKEKGRWRNISALDNGNGIPSTLHRKIFEARVTSKVKDMVEDKFGVHGRGMALYSIKQVADDIRLVNSIEDKGTIIHVRIDTEKIPEKKDQSSFPNLEQDENGDMITMGGPHNVPRVLTEIALSSEKTKLYFGSNAEILATIYAHSVELRKFWASGKNDIRKPLWFELGRVKEGRMLHQFALNKLGLAVSERNAFRILEYEIQPLISVNELLKEMRMSLPARRADLHRQPKAGWSDHLARRISQEDMTSISGKVAEAFDDIGKKYYIEVDTPSIKRRKNRLIISLGLHEKEDY